MRIHMQFLVLACFVLFSGSRGLAESGATASKLAQHDRKIVDRPTWLRNAWRPAYAHFEWDPKMTVAQWCKQAAATGANSIIGVGEMPAGTINGRIITFKYSELKSGLPFEFPSNYRLDYAWVKEMADAAHAENLKCVIYDGSFRTLDPLLAAHPEWRQQQRNGVWYEKGFGSWYTPYRQAYINRWVNVVRNSGADGVMIDMLFTSPIGGDYSKATCEAFERRYGFPAPGPSEEGTVRWKQWIEFQIWTREEVALELTEALHAVNSEFAVIVNQLRGWFFKSRTRCFLSSRVAECVDGLLEEQGWDSAFQFWHPPWGWPTSRAFQNLLLRSRTEPRGGYAQMWHLNNGMSSVETQCNAFSMFGNGVAPAVIIAGNWPEMTEVWRHVARCESAMTGARMRPWLGFHYSEATMAWYAEGGGERFAIHMKNLWGAMQAILELHYPVKIITDDDLADPDLMASLSVVVMPNSACLSDAQAKGVTDFVAGGGGVVGTYETGRFDEYAQLRFQPALTELFGEERPEPQQEKVWCLRLDSSVDALPRAVAIKAAAAAAQGMSVRDRWVTLFSSSLGRLVGAVPQLRTDDKSRGLTLLSREQLEISDNGFIKPEPMSEINRKVAEDPVPSNVRPLNLLTVRDWGRGKAAYFTLDIGHAYFVYGQPASRELLGSAIEMVSRTANPLRTTAPLCVQTTMFERGDELIVHLINDISSFGRAAAPNPEAYTAFRSEVLPIFDTEVEVEGNFGKATLFPTGEPLVPIVNDGRTMVTVHRLDIHQMVVFTDRMRSAETLPSEPKTPMEVYRQPVPLAINQ